MPGYLLLEGDKINTYKLSPPQILAAGFAIIILIGAALLTLPYATRDGMGLSVIDALFTATSAVCVTGLVVVDTGTTFTVFGQIVIMLLIQVGGLGFMTCGTIVAVLIGKKIYFRERLLLQEALNQNSVQGIVLMVKRIIYLTIGMELAGAAILTIRFMDSMPLRRAVFNGIFHSISAFNNAGFDLMGNFRSFTAYVDDPLVSLTIAGLVIIGGLGYAVTLDCVRQKHYAHFSLHTKVVLITTGLLLLAGFAATLSFEYNNPATLAPLNMQAKILAAFFQSVTTRTAGFNTIDTASLATPTLFIVIIFMFIGASPGSTGGGIKTTTFTTLLATVKAIILGQEDVNAFGKHVAAQSVRKAIAIFFISFSLVLLATLLLTIFENIAFLPALFEATSAFGTVGLSMGATSELDLAGKIIVIVTMFCGRLGPLTIAMALASRPKASQIRYPEEKVLVG